MTKKLLLLFVGSSGSGKSTIINQLMSEDNKIKFLISNTTREKRELEQDGVNYFFVTKEEFQSAIENKEILEYDITHKGYYGISRKAAKNALLSSDIVVKDVSMLGVINCRTALQDKADIVSVFLTQDKSVLKKRLIERGEKNYKLRLKIYSKEQSQMSLSDYIIFNNDKDKTIAIIKSIMQTHLKGNYLLPLKTPDKIKKSKINKYIKLIKNGKKLKPIKVCLIDDKIYIVDNLEKYLASIITGKLWTKLFITPTTNLKNKINNNNNSKWTELVNATIQKVNS